MRNVLVAVAIVVGLAASASAQTTVTEYYVVRDDSTKKCTIVSERPTATTMVVVGNRANKTRSEAEGSIKTTKICTDD